MKLERSVLVMAAMVVGVLAATGCKSADKGSQPSNTSDPQPVVQAPSDTAAPSNNNDDPNARRARRHGRGRGEWRKRRAQAQDSGPPAETPEVPAQP